MEEGRVRFIVQVVLSAVVLAVGLWALLTGAGDRSDAVLAAGGVGWIFGFWMRSPPARAGAGQSETRR